MVTVYQLRNAFDWQITFEGIRGRNFEGDIAIDDFSLTPGSCAGG